MSSSGSWDWWAGFVTKLWHISVEECLKWPTSAVAKPFLEVAIAVTRTASSSHVWKSNVRGSPWAGERQGVNLEGVWSLMETQDSPALTKAIAQASKKRIYRKGSVFNCSRRAFRNKQKVFRGWKNPDMSGNVGTGRVCQLFKLSCKLQSMGSKRYFYMYIQVGRIEKKMSINVVPGLNICFVLDFSEGGTTAMAK